ncbi:MULTISPECIES: aminotransferase class I/II-fold pyridoxal phosphate-dependent enzyme [Phyllobacteriaceae]|jgi:aspartate aminotransferase|uniref:aspartate transaminase n=2 Tax=Pseudomonadota TaxID=1224 RepID=A0A1C2E1D9_9HYPH|nr:MULTISPECIES: aminotransferase class I/II-fold pyridoxal phosphate-dependent enzyme [Mesorhizobium]MBN9235620.1 aminotransferase class I/II-fold pyridoxal phosphate-dependent enzyme [Mesorhizobium sp.]MDQ0331225.1 aspartate aminotransferase [Mesorhizobium sp. YL-MeA3-2017]OCX20745.1 aspartate aminotransferase [Mesorhizobium hungaricum]
MLAQRTKLFASSGTAAARAAAKAASDAGKEVIDLTAGEIWSDLAPSVREGALAAIERGENRYTDTVGLRELREALAAKVARETGQVWHGEEIAVTNGAKQALFNAAMVLLDPGDEVIIPSPYWTTFPAQVLIAGGRPVHVDTRDHGYVPRAEDIEGAITPKTRAIVVNTPSNPTGVVYDQSTLEQIADLAIRRDLWIIFDECYGAFAHAPHAHHPIVSLVPEARSRTIIINAFSKTLALTGWRIGYLAAPKSVIDAVKALQSHTTSNPNVIAQHAVLEHLRRGDGSYERHLSEQLTQARRLGLDILSRQAIAPLPKAQGGFYFYLDLRELADSGAISTAPRTADDVVNALLAQAGVAGVSGSAFGDPMGLRLSYGIDHDKLALGLERLVGVFDAWTGATRNVA